MTRLGTLGRFFTEFVKFCPVLSDIHGMLTWSTTGWTASTRHAGRSALIALIILLAVVVTTNPVGAAAISDANAPSGALAVVTPAVDKFEAAFSNYSACLGNPTVVFEDLPGRKGEYRVGLSTVAINPNRDIEGMADVVVHELAHHLMVACGLDKDTNFRDAFYASQGIPLSRGWYDYSAGWSATPAEQFAEAVALSVLKVNSGRIPISDGAVDLVAGLGVPAVTVARWFPKGATAEGVRVPLGGYSASLMATRELSGADASVVRTIRPRLGAAVGLISWRSVR